MSLGDTLNALHMAVDSADSHNVPRASSKKGKKSVRWEDPGKLEQVKLVEVLVYGDEFGNEIATENYFNTTGEMEGEAEGAAMGHLVEELDWEEPAGQCDPFAAREQFATPRKQCQRWQGENADPPFFNLSIYVLNLIRA